MSSVLCDKHPREEAVNGCRLCEQERLDALTDVEVLLEVQRALSATRLTDIDCDYAMLLVARVGEVIDTMRRKPRARKSPCVCHNWDAGRRAIWLAVFGMSARKLFMDWREGKKIAHHPKCERFYDDW